MTGNNAKNLFTKATGLVGGVSAALLLSLPAIAQQGPVNSNSNTSPTPAPAAPNTYSPSTGDPTIRIAPGNNNSSDRTNNVNSVQQPNSINQGGANDNSVAQPYGTSEPANRTRYNELPPGNDANNRNEMNRQGTTSTTGQYRTGQYQTEGIRPLQEPAGRSRYDDRSTGFNQANYNRLAGIDNDAALYPGRNPVRTESRQFNGNTNNPIYNPDGSQVKQLQSDPSSPNQQNPNAGASEGSGAMGNIKSPATPNNGSGRINQNSNYQTPSGSQIPSAQQGNPGTRIGVEERTRTVDQQRNTTTTGDQPGGTNTINNSTQPSTQPSSGTQPASGDQGSGQGAGGQSVPGLW